MIYSTEQSYCTKNYIGKGEKEYYFDLSCIALLNDYWLMLKFKHPIHSSRKICNFHPLIYYSPR